MREYSLDIQAKLRAKVKEYRFVIGFILDVDSIYVTSHEDIADVPGSVINSALVEPIINSQRLRPDDARAEIGTASFSLVDIAGQFTDEIRERLSDGVGLRGVPVRFYFGFAGDAFSDLQLVGTQRVATIGFLNGRYNVQCEDIQRSMKEQIFDVAQTTLAATLTAGDTTIELTDASGLRTVFHGDSYTDAPNSTVGYVKVKNTIYRYTGKSTNTLTGCTPVFGTTAETITVDPGLASDRRERVEEYIYIELPAIKLALAILTGDLYGDGASFPDHWTLSIDSQWIAEEDFTDIGVDIWNTATDASPQSGRVLRFEGLKRIDAKSFLEKEIYLAVGLFSPVYADGSLGLRRMARISEDASHIAVLDNSNSIEVGELKHAMKSLHNVFRVNWSWNGSRYNRANDYIDVSSVSTHGLADIYERNFKGIHGSVHTDASIFTMLDMLRDRYAAPPQEIQVKVFDSLNALEVGDIVRGRWRHVRDYAGKEPGVDEPGIDRAFEIQGVECNFRTGITLNLFGSTARAEVRSPTQATTALPDAFYGSQGTALSSAPGITVVGNVITAATLPLSGNADLNHSSAIYYHNGDLTLQAGVTLTVTNNVQLRIRGLFQINGTLNGVGTGRLGVTDDGHQMHVVFNERYWRENRIEAETYPGIPGYIGASRGYDGVYLFARFFVYLATREAAFTGSAHAVAPVLNLQVDGTTLAGLPDDLRGIGGAPGGRVEQELDTFPLNVADRGGAGGSGGAGLVIICRGLSRGANGLIDLSGGDTTNKAFVVREGVDLYPGAGGAGGPGACYILLDGANLSVPDLGLGFRAFTGTVPPHPGNALYTRANNGIEPAGNYHGPNPMSEPVAGYDDPAVVSDMDFSGAALRVQYIPAPETATPDTESRPPPITNIIVAGVVGGISVQLSAPPPEQWDMIEYYAAATDDRSGATLVNRSRSTSFVLPFSSATTRYFWVRTRREGLTSDWFPADPLDGVEGTSVEGGGGTPGESIQAEFAVSSSGPWHSTFTSGDLYMRTRVGAGGSWQGPWRIVGETGADGDPGADGNFISFVFRRSATQPATPTGNSPSGWQDSPPVHDGNPLWMSRAFKTPAGILVGAWSTPQVLALDGEDGAPGLPGIQGPGLFTWSNPVNVATTASTITKTTGGTANNAGAHSSESYSAGCFFSSRAGQTNIALVIGFNDDPAVDSGVSGINFGWRYGSDGNCYSIQNGTQGASLGTYTTATVLSQIHDGETVRFYKDGAQVGPEIPFTGRLFLDTSINAIGGALLDVHFGPNGSRGPQGSPGAAAQALRLSSTAQAFTFAAGGVTASPAGQAITFSASRQNIATAAVWSTTPTGITLSGSGDTRTLAVTDFGSNASVRVTATAGGFSDSISVVKLSQGSTGATGQASIAGYLTNESHTLPSDSDGVVSPIDYSGAVGFFRVFEGVVDRTSAATFALVTATNCSAQLNTADDTPVNGQSKGFYRVTAVSADSAYVELRGSFNGVDVTKRFSVTRARAGQPGDGQNLLPIGQWVVGTTGNQGDGWFCNGAANESAIVLGGAGTAPLGPYRTSIPLWECRPTTGGGTDGDGGWDTKDIEIDHRKSYRSSVWFYFNQYSGSFYHGCRTGGPTTELTGGVNGNPYFAGASLPSLSAWLTPNKWYLSIGIIHGSGYTGGNSGQSGIYDPETGRRLLPANEFKNSVGAAVQSHRCYHFYDSSPVTRQWMPEPRLEEINGSEPTIDSLLGFQRVIPWIERGYCVAGARTIFKVGGANSWDDSDAYSAVGYATCHLQFKPAQTTAYLMFGLSGGPGASLSYTNLTHAWYPRADGVLEIYEFGSSAGTFLAYTAATQLGISRDASGTVRYYKDGALVRTSPSLATDPVSYMDSSFHTPGGGVTNIAWGPGVEFEQIDTSDIVPNAATEVIVTNVPSFSGSLLAQAVATVTVPAKPRPYTAVVTATGQFWKNNSNFMQTYLARLSGTTPSGTVGQLTTITATASPGVANTSQFQFDAAANTSYTYALWAQGNVLGTFINGTGITLQVEVLKL